jgi:haloacetate dehalogenase
MTQFFPNFAQARIRTRNVDIFARVAGEGPPLLLLHGYPETHVMWHKIAPQLARDFTVVLTDLRGYGASSKPSSGQRAEHYAKREMALDQVEVMRSLGFKTFMVAGHDRGGRVAHRMAIDHPEVVTRLAVLDIIPTEAVFADVDRETALRYFHWFFLAQPHPLPERMIEADPESWLKGRLTAWSRTRRAFSPAAVREYLHAFSQKDAIRASCDDYRAAAGIDLVHDAESRALLRQPLLALWGELGFVGQHYDVLSYWRAVAREVEGFALPCGHFLPEEAPQATLERLTEFFMGGVTTAPRKRVQPSANARPAAG